MMDKRTLRQQRFLSEGKCRICGSLKDREGSRCHRCRITRNAYLRRHRGSLKADRWTGQYLTFTRSFGNHAA